MSSPVDAAVRRLSSFLVRKIAGAMTPAVAGAVRRSVAACRAQMAEAGVTQSVVARLAVAPGTVVQGAVRVFDRKGAYLAECATMPEFAALRDVFKDPVAALRTFGAAVQGEHAAKFQADMKLLFDGALDGAGRKRHAAYLNLPVPTCTVLHLTSHDVKDLPAVLDRRP